MVASLDVNHNSDPSAINVFSLGESEIFTKGSTSGSLTMYDSQENSGVSLYHNTTSHTFVLTDIGGEVLTFNDFGSGNFSPMTSKKDAGGNEIAYSFSGTNLTQVLTTTGTTGLMATNYSYSGSQITTMIDRVSSDGGTSWTTNRITNYAYYGSSDPNGPSGSIKQLTVEDGSSTVLDSTYYRYYTSNSGIGYTGAVKYSLSASSYARFLSAGYSTSSSDANVAKFADVYYEYDSQHRITKQIVQGTGCSACTGGLGTYTYAYGSANNDTTNYNAWINKIAETQPNGTVHTVYTNNAGMTILDIVHSGSQNWLNYYKYDSDGRQIMHADPSAITGYSEANVDLVNYAGGGRDTSCRVPGWWNGRTTIRAPPRAP